MATRALVFDLVGRDKSLGRTFDQVARKSKGLENSFDKLGKGFTQSTAKLRLGVDKANLELKRAEVAATRARESHAKSARIFGRDSDQAYNAALRVSRAQIGVREATLGVTDAQGRLSASTARSDQVAVRSTRQWGHVGASLGRVAKTAALAGAALGAAAAVGVARFAASGVRAAASFDKTMRQFAVVADLPKAQLADMSDLALKMGKDTIFSASQAAQAMLDLAKGGLTAAQIKGGALQASLTLAAAGGIELAAAGDTMANALNMFSLKAKDAGAVAAALAGGANASTASVEDLTLALSQVGPGARNAGLDLQDTVGTLSAFHQAGIKGSDAGTSLKTMLSNLVPHTKKAAAKMKELGLSFTNAKGQFLPITEIAQQLHDKLKNLSPAARSAALAILFGSDATRAATILMNEGRDGIAKYITATKDMGAAEALAKTNTEGAAGAFEQLRGAIETISIKVGTPLLRPLANVAMMLADRLPAGLEKSGGWFKRLWDTIEPVRDAFGRLWETVKTSAGQIGGALASAFKAVSPSVTEGKDSISGFAKFIRVDVVNAVKSFTTWLTDKGIPGFLDFADHYINDFAKPVGKATLSMIDFIVHAFGNLLTVSLRVAGGMIDGFAKAFEFVPVIGDQLKKSKAGFHEWADGVIANADTAAQATEKMKETGGRALDALGEDLKGAKQRYLDFQEQAKIPLTVKIAANINALADGLASGKIKMGEFRIRANDELAKVTSSPARKRMQELLDDVAKGKITIGTFRQKWNEEMRKLQNAERIASVIARLKSPKTLASDIAKAKNLIGLGQEKATGGPISGPGTATSDSIPAWLSTGEHVVSAREVKGAGGHKALEQMRGMWRGAGGFATGGPVRYGTVSQATWDRLLASGWRGRAGDRMEALYSPRSYVRLGSVSQGAWDALLRLGWRGRAGDRMEALYPPRRVAPPSPRAPLALRRQWARARRVSATEPDARRFAWVKQWGLPPSPPGLGWEEDETLSRSMARYRGRPQAYKSFLPHIYAARHKYFARTGYATGGIPGLAAGGRAFQVRSSGTKGLGARIQGQTEAVDRFVYGVGKTLAALANKQFNKAAASAFGGPGIMRALAWARGQEGKPYIWGGVGPRGYDCSGFMSAITNVIMGRNPYHRLFATGSFPTSGWVKGFVRAGFNIGSRRGRPGHMAGTLGGVPVESRGSRGVVVGAGARGAGSALFGGNIWHLVGRSGANGGRELLPARIFDDGGFLPPHSRTLAVNNTSRYEPVGSAAIDYKRLGREVAMAIREAGPPPVYLDRRLVSQEFQYELNRQRR